MLKCYIISRGLSLHSQNARNSGVSESFISRPETEIKINKYPYSNSKAVTVITNETITRTKGTSNFYWAV